MRRVVLLALLALALPVVAAADTLDFENAGPANSTTVQGTATAGSAITLTSNLDVIRDITTGTKTNVDGTVVVSTGTLTAVAGNPGEFSFTGGTVTITLGSSTLFTGTFTSGNVVLLAGGGYDISGTLNNGTAFNTELNAAGTISGDTIVTPEPGTLGLLGTGLVGLAGMVRRKLRG